MWSSFGGIRICVWPRPLGSDLSVFPADFPSVAGTSPAAAANRREVALGGYWYGEIL
jgi:hypothetical protein